MSYTGTRTVSPGRIVGHARAGRRYLNTIRHDSRRAPYHFVSRTQLRDKRRGQAEIYDFSAELQPHEDPASSDSSTEPMAIDDDQTVETGTVTDIEVDDEPVATATSDEDSAAEEEPITPKKKGKQQAWRSCFSASDLNIIDQFLPYHDARVGANGFPLADDDSFWDEAYNVVAYRRSTPRRGRGGWRELFCELDLDTLDAYLPTLDARVGDNFMPYDWDTSFFDDACAVLDMTAKKNRGWRNLYTEEKLEILNDKAPGLDARVGADCLPLWSDHTFYEEINAILASSS